VLEVTAPVGGPDRSRVRLTIIGLVTGCLFSALFARLWYLQVIAAPAAEAAATQNGVRLVYDPAPRGRILDRQGRVVVDNKVSQVITVSRETARKEPDVMKRLAALLGLSYDDLLHRASDPRFSPFTPFPVARDIDVSKIIYVREHQDQFPGVEAKAVAERSYPYGTVAAHILGYVGQINDQELAALKSKGYREGDEIGKTGIEQQYEDVLRGAAGVTKLQVDSKGRVLGVLGSQPPVQGHDLQLTVDLDVQKLAEESLVQGLAAAHNHFDPSTGGHFRSPAGSVLVLDPRDGSVLAMASYPTYDPTVFVNGIKPDVFASLQSPENQYPLVNRAVQGQYASGSTFKLVTAIAALRAGLITPNTVFDDRGSLRVGNQIFYNAGHASYGYVALSRAITVSSDAYFYNIGANFWFGRSRYGTDPIQNVAREFGFGVHTGVMPGAEASGKIPDPASRKREHDLYPKAFPNGQWFAGDNVNMAIGQGEVLVTPIQLASAYGAFANGGTLWEPRLAAHALTQDGHDLQDFAPVVIRKIDLPAAIRDPMVAGFKGAVADPKGTAHAAFAGYPYSALPVAGKTGTAQVTGKQDTAIFVSYAPVDSPQYVIDAFLEQSGFGGDAAAPVVRRIYEGLAGKPAGPIVSPSGSVD
jgi:penicillin-binding protein 2